MKLTSHFRIDQSTKRMMALFGKQQRNEYKNIMIDAQLSNIEAKIKRRKEADVQPTEAA